jgi:hypothetical protein
VLANPEAPASPKQQAPAQSRYVNGWDFAKAHSLGSHEAPMAGNNTSVGISQDRVYKAELSDRRDNLIYLLFGMRPRVAE